MDFPDFATVHKPLVNEFSSSSSHCVINLPISLWKYIFPVEILFLHGFVKKGKIIMQYSMFFHPWQMAVGTNAISGSNQNVSELV